MIDIIFTCKIFDMGRLLVFAILFLIAGACNSSKKSASTISIVEDNATIDSVDYFSKDYIVTHVSNEKRIEGEWKVNNMYRIPNPSPEKLTDITLVFSSGSFNGKGPCNRISGNYKIEDFKISFSNVATTKMACSKLEQESVFLKLLESTIDHFIFIEDRLLLKDKQNNVILECSKR